jgi:hypothetical protein
MLSARVNTASTIIPLRFLEQNLAPAAQLRSCPFLLRDSLASGLSWIGACGSYAFVPGIRRLGLFFASSLVATGRDDGATDGQVFVR